MNSRRAQHLRGSCGGDSIYNLKVQGNGKELNFTLPSDENPECLVITEASGLTENTINLATTQGVNQAGTTLQGQSVQGRTVVLDGQIVGRSTELRKQLLDVVTPQAELTIVYDNAIKLKAYPTSTPTIERKSWNARFQFTLYAPYPYWQSCNLILTDVAGMVPRFRFPINYYDTYFENPQIHMFGERIKEEYTNVYNSGNVPAKFKVVFIARTELSRPSVTLIERPVSTKYITIDKDMEAGEIITVDMTASPPSVISEYGGVTQDIFAYLTLDSTRFELQPGDNLIRYDADANRDNLDVKILRYDAYAGAFGDDATYL